MNSIFTRLQKQVSNASNKKMLNNDVQQSKGNLNDLVNAWQKSHSKDLENQIFAQLKPTIKSALHTFTPGREGKFEIKAAALALKSLGQYDAAKGADVPTYVFSNLRRLQRFGLEADNLIKIPEETLYLQKRIQKAVDDFKDDLNREPTMDELSDKLALSKAKIEKIMTGRTQQISASQGLTEEGADLYGKSDVGQTDYIKYVYTTSDPINKKIIEWSTGLYGVRPLANNDIAKRLKISPAAVSQRKATIQSQVNDVSTFLR